MYESKVLLSSSYVVNHFLAVPCFALPIKKFNLPQKESLHKSSKKVTCINATCYIATLHITTHLPFLS